VAELKTGGVQIIQEPSLAQVKELQNDPNTELKLLKGGRLIIHPFNTTEPALAVSLPLFILIIAVAVLGVVAGGLATWFGQHHWRRAARRHEADARDARAELADLRAAAMASRGEPPRLAGPSQAGFYGVAGRDKQGATL